MDFGEVITKAWKIIWKHKVLWIFGILAGCGEAGTSFGSNSGFRYRGNIGTFNPQQLFPNLGRTELILIGLAILAVVLVLFVIAVVLGTFGRIGLIRGAMQADRDADKLIFGELFSYSGHYFLRVFLLNLVVGLVLFLAFTIFIIGYIGASVISLGILAICLLPCFCLLIPISWLINVWVEQANIALIVEDVGVMAAMSRGWDVFKKNLGNILIVGLILLLIQFVVGGIIGLPFGLAMGPALLGLISTSGRGTSSGWIISLICIVGYLPFLFLLSGILRSYLSSTWTLTYLRLTAPRAPVASQPAFTQS